MTYSIEAKSKRIQQLRQELKPCQSDIFSIAAELEYENERLRKENRKLRSNI